MRAFLEQLLDSFLPRACAGCRARLSGPAVLCPSCAARIPRLPAGGCLRCQHPATPGPLCPACAAARDPLEACLAEVSYAGEGAAWIHRFKYTGPGFAALDPGPAAVAAAWVRAAGERLPPAQRPALLLPVPLHRTRIRARGAHPPALLARALGRAWRVPVAARRLERLRDTPSQTGLSRRARRRNVAGAFHVRPGPPLPWRVGLVDDVVTTGATLAELARVLRRAGARSVVAVCAARTLATG